MNPASRIDYLKRGAANKCPRCNRGPILENLFRRHDACPRCNMDFNREDGFYSGAMAINYALVCFFYLLPLLLIWCFGWLSGWTTVILCFLGSAIFPILAYRYSQALWLGFYCCVTSESLDEE